MTPWSVVNDDTQESGHRRRYFRYAVFALAALLVVSLGFVLIPREPDAPAPPTFSEQARAAALTEALVLRAAGAGLQSTTDGTGGTASASEAVEAQSVTERALGHAVTLLTVHARALMPPANPVGVGTPPVAGTSPTAPSTAQAPPASTPAKLAASLHASGARRLSDAATADGGMARLLAGVGTAQLLAAEELAAATGTALDALTGAVRPSPAPPSAVVPSAATPSPGSSETARCTALAPDGGPGAGSTASGSPAPGTAGSGTGVNLASALTSVRNAELELVYAYQVALTRLTGGTVAPASGYLARHEELRDEAHALVNAQCAVLPPAPAGYVLDQAFLADPAAALGVMEAGVLPAYGDVIALSDGAERAWAVSGLQAAVRRTVYWGASGGPVPGLVLDEAQLPDLPGLPEATSTAPAQGPGPTSSGTP